MALALDGHATNSNTLGGTSLTVTLTTTVSSDVICVAAAVLSGGSSTVSSITSTHTTGWAARGDTGVLGANNLDVTLWIGKATAKLTSEVITVNFSSSANIIMLSAFGFSGADTTTIVDGNASFPTLSSGSDTGTGNAAGNNFSTSNANDALLNIFGVNEDSNPASGSSYNQIDSFNSAGGSLGLATFYLVVSATQSNVHQVNTFAAGTATWGMVSNAIKAGVADGHHVQRILKPTWGGMRPGGYRWRRRGGILRPDRTLWKPEKKPLIKRAA